ncbi:MAG: hypothetical protein ACKO2G_11160 [Verrucomicrobiales bacterium]
MKTILLTTTAMLAFAITASANPEGPRPHRPGGPPKALLEKFDTDGDGKLSEQEREAAKAAMEEKRAAIIAKYDKDGDGKLNEEERKAAKEEWKELHGERPNPPGGPSRERILKRFDKDGDGKLNEQEREAAKAAMKEWHKKNGKGGGNGGGGEEPAAE